MEAVEYQRMRDCEDRHWWYVALHELVLRFVAEEQRTRGALQIFDAGCGTGGLLARLARFGAASGCDYSEHALEHCRARGLSEVSRQDLNELVLPSDSFDVITCMDVLEHAWVRSDAALLSRLGAALRPGGLLLLNCTAFEFLRSTHDEAVLSQRRYTPARLRQLARDAGFGVEFLTCRMFVLFAPLALYRILRRVFRARSGVVPASDVWLPPVPLNAALLLLARCENLLLRCVPLPVGTSVFLVARKPGVG